MTASGFNKPRWNWQDSLYDHYKDSFGRIREREVQRDRQFIALIGLFALIALSISYTAAVTRALAGVTIAGVRVDISVVPIPALLCAVWSLTFFVSLRYCQNCVNVERKYSYLHKVEEQLGRAAGSQALFAREGDAYLDNYPSFSKWAWIAYAYAFPLLISVGALILCYFEWQTTKSPIGFKIADTVLAVGIVMNFGFYRVPDLVRKFGQPS